MDLKKIERLMDLMAKFEVNELEITEGSDQLKIKKSASSESALGEHAIHPGYQNGISALESKTSEAAKTESAKATNRKTITSPFVGTFYRAPSPGAEPFVSIGQRVKKGDVLCIVEAMKLMNEIEAEGDGVIIEILVENEKPVEFEQPLFVMEI